MHIIVARSTLNERISMLETRHLRINISLLRVRNESMYSMPFPINSQYGYLSRISQTSS